MRIHLVAMLSILTLVGCAETARSIQGAISPEFELKHDLAFGGCKPTAGDLIMSSKYSNTEADAVRFEADCKKAAIEKYESKTGKKVVGDLPANLPYDRRPMFVAGVGFVPGPLNKAKPTPTSASTVIPDSDLRAGKAAALDYLLNGKGEATLTLCGPAALMDAKGTPVTTRDDKVESRHGWFRMTMPITTNGTEKTLEFLLGFIGVSESSCSGAKGKWALLSYPDAKAIGPFIIDPANTKLQIERTIIKEMCAAQVSSRDEQTETFNKMGCAKPRLIVAGARLN